MDCFPLTFPDTTPDSSPWASPELPGCTPDAVRADVVVFDDHVLVILDGEVDMASWPVLTGVRDGLEAHVLPVVVDASRVTFLDCEGLRALLSLGQEAGTVSIRSASRAVRTLLEAAARADLQVPSLPSPTAGWRGERRSVHAL